MKPPHGHKPGGSGRPPSNRDPQNGAGGSSNRLTLGGGQRDQRGQDQRGGKPLQARQDRPRTDGPRHGGPRQDQPRREAPVTEGRGAYIDGQRIDPNARHAEGGRRGAAEAPRGAVWLYGQHAVAAALANPRRRLRRLVLTEEAEATLARTLPPPWSLQPERSDKGRIDHLLGRDISHQGMALLADTLPQPGLAEVLERPGPLVVLDQVTDPRNVGAIMRSAAAFGAAAVIVQDRNAPEETGSLAKAASGTLETMPLLRAVNIARTLIALKAANVWCVGLDAAGKPLSGAFFARRRVALVLGAEGDGLRRLTRETCDDIAGLPIKGSVESLNVSAAAAVALYELTRPA
jgi:23S rRNA (guanosine2251-2'-O)-methyltransferase